MDEKDTWTRFPNTSPNLLNSISKGINQFDTHSRIRSNNWSKMFKHLTKIESLWTVTNKATLVLNLFNKLLNDWTCNKKCHFNFPVNYWRFDRFHDWTSTWRLQARIKFMANICPKSSENMTQMAVIKKIVRVLKHAQIIFGHSIRPNEKLHLECSKMSDN